MTETAAVGRGFSFKPSPDFRFIADTHTYFLGRRVLPSITQILLDMKYVDPTYYTEEGRIRGQRVHQAVHYLNKGTLDWRKLDDAYFGYVLGYQRFMKASNFKPIFFELPMYHPSMLFAGTPDLVGTILDNVPAIVEIKTGPVPKWAALQTSGHELLVRAWESRPRRYRRFGLQLNGDGTYQPPREFKDWIVDETVFRSLNTAVQSRYLYGA